MTSPFSFDPRIFLAQSVGIQLSARGVHHKVARTADDAELAEIVVTEEMVQSLTGESPLETIRNTVAALVYDAGQDVCQAVLGEGGGSPQALTELASGAIAQYALSGAVLDRVEQMEVDRGMDPAADRLRAQFEDDPNLTELLGNLERSSRDAAAAYENERQARNAG